MRGFHEFTWSNNGPRNRKAVHDFRGKRSRPNSFGVVGVAFRPNTRFESFHNRDSIPRKEMLDNKAAFSPANHCGLGKEFVVEGG